MSTSVAAPRWDLGFLFPAPDSPEIEYACAECYRTLEALGRTFEGLGILKARKQEDPSRAFEHAIDGLNAYLLAQRRIQAYLHGLVTTNSADEAAQAKMSEFQAKTTHLAKLSTALTAWIGAQDVENLLERSQIARENEHMIRKAKEGAEHLMSAAEEDLASDLSLTGSIAWQKLHGNLTSRIEVEFDGAKLPMSALRNKAYDPDRDVRREAYHAELDAWKRHEIPLAACLNGVKGETQMLSTKRGWSSPVAMACFNANIDEATLEAMMSAAAESFPSFRKYMKAKAVRLGLERLAWFDMFAPLASDAREWQFDEATEFVNECFAGYSVKMAEFARSMVRDQRIDAEPRAGKRDGAYCMGIPPTDSLVMMNFKPSFGSVSTLAHELGHGYHNLCLKDRKLLQRSTPMTLAETASIFCETIIRQAVLQGDSNEQEKLSILEASLQGSCQVVVDIASRFEFEKAIFAKRGERELSSAELCEMMLDAQRKTYGDGLDFEFLHAYMWAVKPHYYSSTFYNFPYMFGLLFGLGLYAIYEKDAERFKGRYDDLLSSTGLADAATLARGFDIDIRSPEFWRGSLRQIERDIDRFVGMGGWQTATAYRPRSGRR